MLGAAEFMGGRFGLTSDESTRRDTWPESFLDWKSIKLWCDTLALSKVSVYVAVVVCEVGAAGVREKVGWGAVAGKIQRKQGE